MKLRVQAQHLQVGDIVGSGEKVIGTTTNAINLPNNKVYVKLEHQDYGRRVAQWGKYTMIGIERAEKVNADDLERIEGELEDRNRE